MADNFLKMNPLYGIYSDFQKILETVVIKYSYLAEKYETFDIKKEADTYIVCKDKTDSFFMYNDYTTEELLAVGIRDVSELKIYTANDGYLKIPEYYHNKLLENRRSLIIKNYKEQNDYYRKLNGYPSINTPKVNYHYISQEFANKYGMSEVITDNIPIHEIQDYYNDTKSNKGDYYISIIEGTGLLNDIKSEYPDDDYLNYIGSNRIDISTARKAKNFELLRTKQMDVSNLIYDEFIKSYEQARDYFVSSIFIREHRDIIQYYDQFIALCIMSMTFEIIINKQFKLGIDRKYYNNYTIKLLYDSYGIPYNMNIDEYTQRSISQSLNSLIQKKSTDQVFYNITDILGFNNLKIYRYYLTKERKFDEFGIPIIAHTEKFNSDSGEIERNYDYKKMYDVYFQKVELPDTDFVNSYNNTANIEKYEKITGDDPFWWEDERTYNSVWDTEYNFVEAKYVSVGLSYKMTEIMYENILLLKLLLKTNNELESIKFTLPKIDNDISVTLFDSVILLICLMAKKHNLRGEIISIPSQVISVLEYLHNTDGSDDYDVDCFDFNMDILKPENKDGRELINAVKSILGDDAEKFNQYINALSNNNSDKIALINNLFTNIKGLSSYIQYLMSKTSDRKTYEILKEFYNTAFYSKEVKSVFTINNSDTSLKRIAKNYFEFLYYYNPKLYSSLFVPNFEGQFDVYQNEHKDDIRVVLFDKIKNEYSNDIDNNIEYGWYFRLSKNDRNKYDLFDYNGNKKQTDIPESIILELLSKKYIIKMTEYTLTDYKYDVDYGIISDFTYSTLKSSTSSLNVMDDLLYYYIDHIISRMEMNISNLKYIYMVNDTATPIEELLIKLINFFKSFTVDMLGLDITYLVDLRAENTMKLISEIDTLSKELSVNDKLNVSYIDLIHIMNAVLNDNIDKLLFSDKVIYNSRIFVRKDSKGNKINEVSITDIINYIKSEIVEHDNLTYNDFINMIYKSLDTTMSDLKFSDNIICDSKLSLITDLNGDKFNNMVLNDNLSNIKTEYGSLTDISNNSLRIFDVVGGSSNVSINDNNKLFNDKIAYKFYS